jgi:hypothetical protein
MSEGVVYVAGMSSGGTTDYYHENPDCRALKDDTSVHEYSRERIVDRREPCSFCAEGGDT